MNENERETPDVVSTSDSETKPVQSETPAGGIPPVPAMPECSVQQIPPIAPPTPSAMGGMTPVSGAPAQQTPPPIPSQNSTPAPPMAQAPGPVPYTGLPSVPPRPASTYYGTPGQAAPQQGVPAGPQPPTGYGVPTQGAYPPPPLPQVVYQPPREPVTPPLNGLAIASMVLGIISIALICCCCAAMSWLTSLVGLILGIVACAKGNRTGMTIAGLILNGLALLFTLMLVAAIFLGSEYQYEYLDRDWLDGTYL